MDRAARSGALPCCSLESGMLPAKFSTGRVRISSPRSRRRAGCFVDGRKLDAAHRPSAVDASHRFEPVRGSAVVTECRGPPETPINGDFSVVNDSMSLRLPEGLAASRETHATGRAFTGLG